MSKIIATVGALKTKNKTKKKLVAKKVHPQTCNYHWVGN